MESFLQKLTHFLWRFWPIVFLCIIQIFLVSTNFTPNTHLVGWDNLFPEFNFNLNFERTLFGSWQEYRGLGYEDGMSHTANLPYYLLLYFFSLFLPEMSLRYVGMFFTHLLGGVGMYVLILSLLTGLAALKKKDFVSKKDLWLTRLLHQLPALVGALFYQYNFATIQMYYLPFEPFSVHFAFLPWLILCISQYLQTKQRSWLFWLAGFSFAAASQAHVPTVFISFGFIVGFFMLFSFIKDRTASIKPILLVILILFTTNAFWGVPFAYSTIRNAHIIANSKNNQMATPDIFVKNQKFGTFKNTVLLRGFSLDYIQYDHTSDKSDYMMKQWISYIERDEVQQLGWVFFILSLAGIVVSLVRRDTYIYPYIASFAFTFSVIGNDIPGVEVVSFVLRNYVPLFKEIFRFVFTKFFILHAFSLSILIALSVAALAQYGHKYLKLFLVSTASVLVICAIFYTVKPAFQGNFFHPLLREAIPQEYTQLFEFFKDKNKDERIAILPIPWYWAWTQYEWGVIGSGFQWFGLQQPTLDLAFIPWSQKNENVHWELMYALRSGDVSLLETVTRKYQIQWLVVDENIHLPNPDSDQLVKNSVETILATSASFQLAEKFGEISVYKVTQPIQSDNFVSVIEKPVNIGPKSLTQENDQAASDHLLYQTNQNESFDQYYPFRSLFTGKSQSDLEFEVIEKEDYISFRTQLPKDLLNYTLVKPVYDRNALYYVELDPAVPTAVSYPVILLDGKPIVTVSPENEDQIVPVELDQNAKGILEVVVPKVTGILSYDSDPWNDFEQTPTSCDPSRTGTYEHELIPEADGTKTLRLTSQNSSNCISFLFPNFAINHSYLLTVEAKNIKGRGLFMSVYDLQSKTALFDTYLDAPQKKATASFSYIIPPSTVAAAGYTVNFDNLSFANSQTINELHRVAAYQIPYEFLSELKLTQPGQPLTTSTPAFHEYSTVSHPNPTFYSVEITPNQLAEPQLVLWQGNYSGWIAFIESESFPFFTLLNKKSTVNNWAQSWDISTLNQTETNTIYLLFFPQILTYLGFAILVSTPVLIFIFQRK